MAGPEVHIDVARQQLHLMLDGAILRTYPVSTALNGMGEHNGSGCTPRGLHRVRAKVGAGCAHGTVFVGRRPTGEVYTPRARRRPPGPRLDSESHPVAHRLRAGLEPWRRGGHAAPVYLHPRLSG